MLSYIKYFLVANPTYGITTPIRVEVPSQEEHLKLLELEPTKIDHSYEYFCINYINRFTKDVEQLRTCKYTIEKVVVGLQNDEETITDIEKRADFVGWFSVGNLPL